MLVFSRDVDSQGGDENDCEDQENEGEDKLVVRDCTLTNVIIADP